MVSLDDILFQLVELCPPSPGNKYPVTVYNVIPESMNMAAHQAFYPVFMRVQHGF